MATAKKHADPTPAAAPLDVEAELLQTLNKQSKVVSEVFAESLGVPHQDVVGVMKSLQGDLYVDSVMSESTRYKLNEEAREIVEKGSPEFRVWDELSDGKVVEQKDLIAKLGPVATLGIQNGMKLKVFVLTKEKKPEAAAAAPAGEEKKEDGKKAKEEQIVKVSRAPAFAAAFDDAARTILTDLVKDRPVAEKEVEALKKRKLVAVEKVKTYEITKGAQFSVTRKKAVADLTKEMLADGSWATTSFKPYNFDAEGKEVRGGNLHPLLKVRQEFREIFLELGFQEMDTVNWVENSFWNFDTLFVPQKHPARDAQDTFFVSKPEMSQAPPKEYLETVRKTHEEGYKCEWNEQETLKNVLRTHTTAVSSWVLYNLAQASPMVGNVRQFTPGAYFSIDRVFRNEDMDKTHLCEFHQVEGFIVDRNLSLAHMMHTLHQFFTRVGIKKLRFKPAYNPYTEPSMEIFGFHDGMKKWMEVGNSGMFRPEMLKPMGFDDDVTAIAWGLSLERPTMIKYGINNIHDLFGHAVDLKFIKRSAIARY